MLPVREVSPGVFEPAFGSDVVSLDGKVRAPLSVILHESWTAATRAEFGIFMAMPAPAPTASQRITSSSFVRDASGTVKHVHTLEDKPLADLKTAKLQSVGGLAMQTLGAGYRPTGTKLLAGHTLQATLNDQDRLHKSVTLYRRKVDQGFGAKLEARFRTLANQDIYLSYTDGISLIVDQMGDWTRRIEHKVWDLKNQILAATDKTALDLNRHQLRLAEWVMGPPEGKMPDRPASALVSTR